MLIFTNREVDLSQTDENAISASYIPLVDRLSFFSVAPKATVKTRWSVSEIFRLSTDSDAVTQISKMMKADRPVLVYVHGNNNDPAGCFGRCLSLEKQYNVNVIGFSWASEGFQPNGDDLAGVSNQKVNTDTDEDSLSSVKKSNVSEGWIQRKARRYAQAKVNAQQSSPALARFFRLVAAARLATMSQPFSVALHSLGCHFLHYTITKDGAAESLGVAQNVALIAGCTGSSKHISWVQKIRPVKRVYITYAKVDTVLAAASVIDGDTKLGTNPGPELISDPLYRYIDFENVRGLHVGAHRYFIAEDGKKLSKESKLLFSRIFSSDLDFSENDKSLRVVYPIGCNGDRSVCYMGGGISIEG
jgi:hypothetical protein